MAVLEDVIGWIARDKNGTLRFYSSRPVKRADSSFMLPTSPGEHSILTLPSFFFPQITWENSPITTILDFTVNI